uniref:Protein kinase domain-containing protein n=1 Tax=Coccolithus braarudii TaxID=221442 RepID=A0A7S0KZT9_9EUKA
MLVLLTKSIMLTLLTSVVALQLGTMQRAMCPRRAVPPMLMPSREQEAAKQAWLEKFDEVSKVSLVMLPGGADATANSIAVHKSNVVSADAAAQQAWLARLNGSAWIQAAAAVATAAAAAPQEATIDYLRTECENGDADACRVLSTIEPPGGEKKRRWLSRLDAPTWSAVAAAVFRVASFVTAPNPALSTVGEASKKAWLSHLDSLTWGEAASALTVIAGTSAAIEDLLNKCDSGDANACELMSKDGGVKLRGLARLDGPTWGSVTAAVEAVAAAMSTQSAMSAEEIVEHAWLGQDADPSSVVTGEAASARAATRSQLELFLHTTANARQVERQARPTLSTWDRVYTSRRRRP